MAWLFKPCRFASFGMKLHKIIVVAEVSDCYGLVVQALLLVLVRRAVVCSLRGLLARTQSACFYTISMLTCLLLCKGTGGDCEAGLASSWSCQLIWKRSLLDLVTMEFSTTPASVESMETEESSRY